MRAALDHGEMEIYRTGPETDRLLHRVPVTDDAAALFALNGNPLVMRYTGEPLLTSVDEARRKIETYADFETIGYGRWLCVLKRTGSVIGFCGLKYLPEFDEVDVGYRFLPEYWGQGLATEACAASVDFAFQTLKLQRVIGLVLPENVASIRVLEKVGMRLVGEVAVDQQAALRFEITPMLRAPASIG